MDIFYLILGLVTLIVGGEFLVKGGVGIAKKIHLSSLVIGMTVVSFGTSAPELIVSAKAAIDGSPEIALGNVIGSNIANIALVLGITIMIFPIIVNNNSKFFDWPMMILSTVLFFAFAHDGSIVMWEGAILMMTLIAFTWFLITHSRRRTKKEIAEAIDEGDEVTDLDEVVEVHDKSPSLLKSLFFLGIGLTGLFFGAEWLLNGAVGIARSFGMEERVIGITIIAFGTSVPELVTSAVAAFRKETDIALGNLIGSNIFNIMSVIGITAIIHPIEVSRNILSTDMIWMLGISLALFPLMIIGKKMGRLKGVMLFGTYVAYISILLINM
jgi:cation:H+ antiporter